MLAYGTLPFFLARHGGKAKEWLRDPFGEVAETFNHKFTKSYLLVYCVVYTRIDYEADCCFADTRVLL